MKTADKIKKLRLEKGLSQEQLGELVGLQKAAINKYETGRVVNIKRTTLQKFAMIFDVSPAELLDDAELVPVTDLTNVSMPAARAVPVLGTICAGNGIFCEENYEGFFFVDRSIRADLCLNVKGDSMIEADIFDGDKAFISQNCIFEEGKIYAVRINSDTEAVLKRVFRQGDNVILNSCNPEYSPMVEKASNVSIIGECIGVYHALENRR